VIPRRLARPAWLLLLSGCPAIDVSVGSYVLDAAPLEPVALDSRVVMIDANLRDASPMVEQSDGAANPVSLYLEAESGALSGGFTLGSDPAASGGQYLVPPPDPLSDAEPGRARATYALSLPEDGTYVLWGRIRAPDAGHNRFWFRLDDGPWHLWRISTGDIWFWDDLHEDRDYAHPLTFALREGPHRLTLANASEGVGLDRLYLTSRGDVPPGNETLCRPPHSIDIAGRCLASCGAQQGQMCGAAPCTGKPLIEAYDCDVCCGS